MTAAHAPTTRTADEVWAWLLNCTVCGEEHQFRQVTGARDAWSYRRRAPAVDPGREQPRRHPAAPRRMAAGGD